VAVAGCQECSVEQGGCKRLSVTAEERDDAVGASVEALVLQVPSTRSPRQPMTRPGHC